MRTNSRIALVLASCFVLPANAALITFEPDDYEPGTNLTRTVTSLQLWDFYKSNDTVSFGDVYAATDLRCATAPNDCQAITGTTVFSRERDGYIDSPLASRWYEAGAARNCFLQLLDRPCASNEQFAALLIRFDTPTDYVELSGAYYSDWPILFVFDSSRNQIGGTNNYYNTFYGTGPDGGFNTSTAHFQSDTENISYVIAAGWAAPSSLDVLRYNGVSVPEPGTLLLLSAGLAAMFGIRRRHGRNGHVRGDDSATP